MLLREYAQSDYERLRDKLLRGLTRLRVSLPVVHGELPKEHFDSTGTKYLYVEDDRRSHHAHGGFGGGFYIAAEPISQGAFFQFLSQTDHDFPQEIIDWLLAEQSPQMPMIYTTWIDACAYCHWLSAANAGFYDLPFEQEWKLAGEVLAPLWPAGAGGWMARVKTVEPAEPKWLPPGMLEFGSVLGDEDTPIPGGAGRLWEWCDDWVPTGSDSHLICSGLWSSSSTSATKEHHRDGKVLHHAWPAQRRVGTAGFRTIYLSSDCLRASHHGILGLREPSSPVTRYLADVVNSPINGDNSDCCPDLPIFYNRLPMETRERVETVRCMTRKIDLFLDQMTPGHPRGLDQEAFVDPSTPIGPGGTMNVTQIHSLADRRPPETLDDGELDRARIRVAREIMASSETYHAAHCCPFPDRLRRFIGISDAHLPVAAVSAALLIWAALALINAIVFWHHYGPWVAEMLRFIR